MTQVQFKNLEKNQIKILQELAQLKAKIVAFDALRRFEALAKRGRKFAKEAGIKPKDVLRDD